MELLRIHNFSYDLKGETLFKQLSFNVQKGQRLALIGNNGTGKSTLLRFLVERRDFEGAFRYAPALQISSCGLRKRVEHLSVWDVAKSALEPIRALELSLRNMEQALKVEDESLPEKLEAYAALIERYEALDAYNAEKKLQTALRDLEFKEDDFKKSVSELSGGQKQRLDLVACLYQEAELYLLDEPSNFLDLDAKAWLIESLKASKSFIIASHDRALIDKCCGYVLELKNKRIKRHRGNYSRFRQQQGIHLKSLGQRKSEAQKEYDNLVEGMRKLKTGSRQHFLLRKRLAKLEEEIHGLESNLMPDAGLPQTEVRQQRRKGALLRAEKLSLDGFQVKEVPIYKDVKFQLSKGEKLALVGKNGIGKSSLFNMLAGQQESDDPEAKLIFHSDSRLGYFDQQHRGLVAELTLLDQFEAHVSTERAEMLLSLVGLAERWHDTRDQLSLGEKARAGLALIMASEANILILDEPSEGLDIAMLQKLEDALLDSEAAIIFSSHDEQLVSAIANRVCSFEDAALVEYRGGLGGGLEGYYKKQYRLEKDSDAAIEFFGEFSDFDDLENVTAKRITRQSLQDKRDSLEIELSKIDKKFLDPFALAEREYERLKERQQILIDELVDCYDRLLPSALVKYELRSATASIVGDVISQGRYEFTDSQKNHFKVLIQEGIGHIVPSQVLTTDSENDVSALALLKRIAFERLGAKALQIQSKKDLTFVGFKDAGAGWWLAQRVDYEKLLLAGFPEYERLRLEPLPKTSNTTSKKKKKPKKKARRKPKKKLSSTEKKKVETAK